MLLNQQKSAMSLKQDQLKILVIYLYVLFVNAEFLCTLFYGAVDIL